MQQELQFEESAGRAHEYAHGGEVSREFASHSQANETQVNLSISFIADRTNVRTAQRISLRNTR